MLFGFFFEVLAPHTAVLANVNKMGGTVSPDLNRLTKEL